MYLLSIIIILLPKSTQTKINFHKLKLKLTEEPLQIEARLLAFLKMTIVRKDRIKHV
jgi:hypothetical protein